jgi:hypothetical protein
MSIYFTTRHLWLQRRDDKISVGNVSTKRRVLLSTEQLPELERYAQGAELDPGEVSQRLVAADLIVTREQQPGENPRREAILFAVDKYLAEQRRQSRSQVTKEHPEPLERLEILREIVCEKLKLVAPRVDRWKRRSGVDDFGALLDHVKTFLNEDAGDPGAFIFPAGYLASTAGRPLPRYDYEQQPCMPATTVNRVKEAAQNLKPDSRALVLGDDDLIGLLWSQQHSQPADVFELDTELIDFLRPQLADHVSIRERDLTHGLPEEFRGLYDVTFTDPMYRADGMDLFMLCAASGLGDDDSARVYFSTQPDLIQDGKRLEERLREAGLAVDRQLRNFSRYPMPDFARKLIMRDFLAWQAPAQLVDGLLNIPYFYADLFVLKKV